MIEITNHGRVRLITLERPEAKNAMNEAMWDGLTEALIDAARSPTTAAVVMTGSGDSFCAGQDVIEMAMATRGEMARGTHGFKGACDQLVAFPKPFLLAVNGLAVGFGATVIGHADLVFMSTRARLKCPFTSLGVAPELASSHTFPQLIGRQRAMWALLSSEWLSAQECHDMGLVFKLCEPPTLLDETMRHARVLAEKPISSLVASKRVVLEASRDAIAAARAREDAAFAVLLGAPANVEAMQAFAEKRKPDFSAVND